MPLRPRFPFALRILLLAVGVMPLAAPRSGRADGPAARRSMTDAEEAALDRALDAANLVRADLLFVKDLARGHGAFPIVRALLEDPLRIAPTIDGFADRVRPDDGGAFALESVLRTDEIAPDRTANDVAEITLGAAAAPDGAIEALTVLLAIDLEAPFRGLGGDEVADRALRRHLPSRMAWHEVFASPFDASTDEAIDAWTKDRDDAWLHDRMRRLDLAHLTTIAETLFVAVRRGVLAWPPEAFPRDAALVVETPHGRIGLGTLGDDVWRGDFAIVVDPGGNDRYEQGRFASPVGLPGRRLGLLIDLAGDDVYACEESNETLGCAILGFALLCDLGAGNDRYRAGHASLGAACGGVAVLLDDGGSDRYEGRTFTQGAAGYGIGALLDGGAGPRPTQSRDEGTPDPVAVAALDNDRFVAWSSSQAFSRCRGLAILANARGNDTYEAGGVYLHAPLFADRYQSFSQGFSIGERGIDHAGGIAILLDYEGNDRYLGDVYNQGVGYWYAAGLLYDGAGNDLYEMTQYGQGSGIHLAVGGLVDESGNDTYVMHSGLGQGSSHDYAGSVLHDRGGNDRYLGNTSCNGSALTNSVGLHIDRSGDDLYAARREGGVNVARPARGFGSIGVLLDLGGRDDYLGAPADDAGRLHTDLAISLDLDSAPPATSPTTDAATADADLAPIPAICSFEGELTAAVFDELWALAVRWEVGDNRRIVPIARARIASFGPAALPHLHRVFGKSEGGLAIRGFAGVLRPLAEAGHEAGVHDLLRTNLASGEEARVTVALQTITEARFERLAADVAALLDAEDRRIARRAAGVIRALGATEGRETLLGWLDSDGDPRDLAAALEALLGGGADVYAAARPFLDHPDASVRGRLIALLAARPGDYADDVRADLARADLPRRVRRGLLDVLRRADLAPTDADVAGVAAWIDASDAGMRSDAARLLRTWAARADAPASLGPALARLEAALASESDSFVRDAGAR